MGSEAGLKKPHGIESYERSHLQEEIMELWQQALTLWASLNFIVGAIGILIPLAFIVIVAWRTWRRGRF